MTETRDGQVPITAGFLAGRGMPRTPFDHPRNFLQNRFVYVVMSSRARGLSAGVNMSPDMLCNFNCIYCESNRNAGHRSQSLDVNKMEEELVQTLQRVYRGQLRELPLYHKMPGDMLELRQVALSGDGEPTLCPQFAEAVQAVVHLRALGMFPFFKMVLVTNASGLDLAPVQTGLKFFTHEDEIWVKLDAGTQSYMSKINRTKVLLEKILANILLVARERPVVIQSLFPALQSAEPPPEEIEEYCQRLHELKSNGAQISLVQIYSARRPMSHQECGHLPLKALSQIARRVREITGLRVEVF